MSLSCRLLFASAFLLASALPVQAQAPKKWESAIAAFEEQDRREPPAKGGNLFVGSSSIRLWNLADAFPDQPCLNRGFGGSQLPDVVQYVDRIVIPYRPSVIVLYAGDNDLAAGKTPEQVRDAYRAFVEKVRTALPQTKIIWIAIKPSASRWKIHERGQAANALVRAEIEKGTNQVELNFWNDMLGENGEPRPELYRDDKLHLSAEGYRLWSEKLRPHLVTKAHVQ